MPGSKAVPVRLANTEDVIFAVDRRRDAFLDVIRSARSRLLISLFRCTDFAILDAIADALHRNVEVKLLLTPRARGWVNRLKQLGAFLESMGAQVRSHADPVVKYHAKYMLADDGPALIGTANLTAKCFSATCDFILLTHDPRVVSGLQALFETDWLAPHSTFPSSIDDRLIVGPDRARAQLTGLLGHAKRSIRIIDHKVNDPNILALLKARQEAGVDVQILGSDYLGGLLPHGKLTIIDGKTAILGSMALSALSMDFRREVSVRVDDPRCVRKLRDFYHFLAGGGELLDPAYTATFVKSEEQRLRKKKERQRKKLRRKQKEA